MLIVHPTCPASRDLIKALRSAGFLDEFEVVVADNQAIAFKWRTWSVPWIVVNDRPAAGDPIGLDEIEALLEGRGIPPRDPVEAFKTAVMHSSFASSVMVVAGSIKPLLNDDFLSAATRQPLTGVSVSAVADALLSRSREIYEELVDKSVRLLGVGYVRELYWASGGAIRSEEVEKYAEPHLVAAWVMAKASIGRVGIPINPMGALRNIAEEIAEFVQRSSRGLLNKVKAEYEEIYVDKEYMALLEKYLGSRQFSN